MIAKFQLQFCCCHAEWEFTAQIQWVTQLCLHLSEYLEQEIRADKVD